MTVKELSECCAKGNLHEGEVSGTTKHFFGVNSYVSGESQGDARNIVIYSDIFGIGLKNNLLIADRLADAGYRVFIPDLFDGDFFTSDSIGDLNWEEFGKWKERQSPEQIKTIATKFLADLRLSIGSEKFIAVIGHCFGAGFAVGSLSAEGLADVGAIAHPSQTSESLFAAVRKPLLISAAEIDSAFPEKNRHEAEKVLSENKIRYEMTLFSGVSHGFAVRGDVSDPVVKYAKEKVLSDQIKWFNQFGNQ